MAEDNLSPEEMQELEELRGLELSSDEQSELEELRALEAPASKTETVIAGGLQGLTLGHSDEIAAAVGTAKDVIFDENLGLSDISAVYNKRVNEERSNLKKLEKANPTLYMGSEIIGGVASTLVPGGIGAKLAANTLKTAVATGSIAGLGFSEGFDPGSIAIGAAGGAVGLGVGRVIGKQLGKFQKPGRLRKAAELERKKANLLLKTVGVDGKADMNKLGKSLRFRNLSMEQFTDDLFKDLDITPEMDTKAVHNLIKSKKDDLWNNTISPIFEQADAELPEGAINPKEILEDLQSQFSDFFLDATDDKIVRSIERVVPRIQEAAEQGRGMTFNEIQGLKRALGRKISATSQTDANEMRRITNMVLREHEDEGLRQVFGDNKVIMAARRRYGNLAEIDEQVSNTLVSEATDSLRSDVSIEKMKNGIKTILNITSPRKSFAEGLSSIAHPTERIDALANWLRGGPDISMPAKWANSVSKIADKMKNQPGLMSKHADRIFASAGRKTEDFMQTLGIVESYIDLEENPIQRNSADILSRSPQILNIVNDFSPELGQQLQQGYENGDESLIKDILSTVSRLPGAKRFVEPGLGIDGKVANETDIAEAKQAIKTAPVSSMQKLQHMKNLVQDGIVPQFQPEEPSISEQAVKRRNENGRKQVDF